jgi:hypothetical protein
LELELIEGDIRSELIRNGIEAPDVDDVPPQLPIVLHDNEGHAFGPSSKISMKYLALNEVRKVLFSDKIEIELVHQRRQRWMRDQFDDADVGEFVELGRGFIRTEIATGDRFGAEAAE